MAATELTFNPPVLTVLGHQCDWPGCQGHAEHFMSGGQGLDEPGDYEPSKWCEKHRAEINAKANQLRWLSMFQRGTLRRKHW